MAIRFRRACPNRDDKPDFLPGSPVRAPPVPPIRRKMKKAAGFSFSALVCIAIFRWYHTYLESAPDRQATDHHVLKDEQSSAELIVNTADATSSPGRNYIVVKRSETELGFGYVMWLPAEDARTTSEIGDTEAFSSAPGEPTTVAEVDDHMWSPR